MRSGASASARSTAPAGGLLVNRYQLLGEVARGGCGAVFEGHDLHLDRLVAIKILQADGFDRAAAARFAREARVAAAIHHPNVCTVTDSGMLENGSPFIVMERLYGETLRAYNTRVGRIDAEEAIEIAVQMLSGLEAAHVLGIVHRDMKPENVFVLRPPGGLPLVKLLDFGMCRRQSASMLSLDADDHSLTRAGTVVGTPEYMAPEQASGRRKFDQRIDLYAVGVMLYEMLTGTRAFTGPDPRSVLVSVLARQLPSVRTIRPELPVAVDRIVARAVERDPRARYASTGEYQNDLLHARTALRRQRQARADVEARHRSDGHRAPWDLPTMRNLTRFRRPA